MDTKRNIQKNSSLSLLDMRMEQFVISLSKKCDRLATALYLVTNFLSDTEPLKLRLRALSLELVRGATMVRYGTIEDESNILGTVAGNISETLGLFELAFINGLISEMNFSILKREYISLNDAIQIRKTSRTSRTDTLFGESFFGPAVLGGDSYHPDTGALKDEKLNRYFQGQTKGHFGLKDIPFSNKMSDRNTDSLEEKVIETGKGHHSLSNKNQKITESLNKEIKDISLSMQSRRLRIIKLVKDKKEVSIKDITDHFPEISEKTIQRELVSLTEAGVFKKTGARRWSRYALA